MHTLLALNDINSGALTEVVHAANSFYSEEKGLAVRQTFYIYPNDSVIALNCCDGTNSVIELRGDDYETFRALYPEYFKP